MTKTKDYLRSCGIMNSTHVKGTPTGNTLSTGLRHRGFRQFFGFLGVIIVRFF